MKKWLTPFLGLTALGSIGLTTSMISCKGNEQNEVIIDLEASVGGKVDISKWQVKKGTKWSEVEDDLEEHAKPYVGYTFDGWYNGDEPIDSEYIINEHITATAKFNMGEWGEEQARIVDSGQQLHLITNLVGSHICDENGEQNIVCDDETTYARGEFNLSIELNPTLTQIPNGFLSCCTSFNKEIGLPNTLESVGESFMYRCNSMISKINIQDLEANIFVDSNQTLATDDAACPIHAHGIEIIGTHKDDFLAKLPNCDFEGPFRRLWVAEREAYFNIGRSTLWTTSLIDSHICGRGDMIQTDDGHEYPRYNFNYSLYLNPNLTNISDDFLWSCAHFDKSLTLPDNLKSIGDNFLCECREFNKSLVLPNMLENIGKSFMYNCKKMAAQIDIQDLSTDVFNDSDETLATNDNQAEMYTHGIKIVGNDRLNFLVNFPNTETKPYRQLLYDEHAYIVDNGTIHWITDLTDSNICAQSGPIICQDGTTYERSSFNLPLYLNKQLTNISDNFLCNCVSFNQPLTLPNKLESVGESFMYGCDNMASEINIQDLEADVFSTSDKTLATNNYQADMNMFGISIVGTNRDNFLNRFPNSLTSPYRKLWGENQAFINENGTIHLISSLIDSHICDETGEANIVCADGTEYDRKMFNFPLYLNPNISNIPEFFMYKCESFNQPILFQQNMSRISNGFLCGCTTFNHEIDLSRYTKLTFIGSNFLAGCKSFDSILKLPPNLETIENYFLQGSAFNHPLVFPKSLTYLGVACLVECSEFNQPIDLSNCAGLQTLERHFMSKCTNFNSELSLPDNLSSIGEWFMAECTSFNQQINLPSGLTSIGQEFMAQCGAFNNCVNFNNCTKLKTIDGLFLSYCNSFDHAIDLSKCTELETIGGSFLSHTHFTNYEIDLSKCTKLKSIGSYFLGWNGLHFNCDVKLPSSLENIGFGFMYMCQSFNHPMDLSHCTKLKSIDGYFMWDCSDFNSRLSLPNSLTSIGAGFLYDCMSFNQNLTLSNKLENVGSGFMCSCDNMTSYVDIQDLTPTIFGEDDAENHTLAAEYSLAPMFKNGVEIRGKNKQQFLDRFKNTGDVYPYRNLYVK